MGPPKRAKKNVEGPYVTHSLISNNYFLSIPPPVRRTRQVGCHTWPIAIYKNKRPHRDNIHLMSDVSFPCPDPPPRLPRRNSRLSTITLILLLSLSSSSLRLSSLLPATPDHNHAQETPHDRNPDQNQNDRNPDRPHARWE